MSRYYVNINEYGCYDTLEKDASIWGDIKTFGSATLNRFKSYNKQGWFGTTLFRKGRTMDNFKADAKGMWNDAKKVYTNNSKTINPWLKRGAMVGGAGMAWGAGRRIFGGGGSTNTNTININTHPGNSPYNGNG